MSGKAANTTATGAARAGAGARRAVPDAAGLRAMLGLAAPPLAALDGQGVRVALIDFGFRGYADAARAGIVPDLPRTHVIDSRGAVGLQTDRDAGDDSPARAHGTAVLEILYAIAPRAEYFLLEVDDYAGCVAALRRASALGAHVVHNAFLQWTNGWGDGSGPLAQAVTRTRAAGSVVVVPAGNAGNAMYMADFAAVPGAGDCHDWHAGALPRVEQAFGAFNRLRKAHPLYHYVCRDRSVNPIGVRFAGDEIRLYLKWAGADPATCFEAALVKFDLCDRVWRDVAGAGVGSARAGRRPVSVLRHTVGDDGLGIYGVRLRLVAGAPDRFHLYLDHPDGLGVHMPACSLAVPCDAPGALVVAASRTASWPRPDVPAYSARGPGKNGVPKPDFAAPSSVRVRCDGGQARVLEGTCTASTVVAAVASLAWQRCSERHPGGRERIARRVYESLLRTARPATGAPGRAAWGSGLLDAYACLQAADDTGLVTSCRFAR